MRAAKAALLFFGCSEAISAESDLRARAIEVLYSPAVSTALLEEERAEGMADGLFPAARFIQRLYAAGAVRVSADYETYEDHNPDALKVELAYRIDRHTGGPVYVTFWFWALWRGGSTWETTQYSMHFGPKPRGDYYLRVCDNPTQGQHFHHFGYLNAYDEGHIPAEKSKPRIPTRADGDWFMSMLEAFLKTNQVPIEVIL